MDFHDFERIQRFPWSSSISGDLCIFLEFLRFPGFLRLRRISIHFGPLRPILPIRLISIDCAPLRPFDRFPGRILGCVVPGRFLPAGGGALDPGGPGDFGALARPLLLVSGTSVHLQNRIERR